MNTRVDADSMLSVVRGATRRVTTAKRTVAEVVSESQGHLTVDEITVAVQRRRPEVSPSTVYRILDEFEELGLVVHSHLGSSAAVYHAAGLVHAHLTCEECQVTIEIPASHFDRLSRDLLKTFGFQLDRHHVALSGRCRLCREKSTDDTTSRPS